MKTKVVQHVPRINLSYFKFQIFKFFQIFQISKFSNFLWFPAFVWLSDIFLKNDLNNMQRFWFCVYLIKLYPLFSVIIHWKWLRLEPKTFWTWKNKNLRSWQCVFWSVQWLGAVLNVLQLFWETGSLAGFQKEHLWLLWSASNLDSKEAPRVFLQP